MSTTKTFSGPDLGALLEEVQAEFGGAAKVVAANRCRSGGFAGFFATESFELIVETQAEPVATTPRRGRLARRADARAVNGATGATGADSRALVRSMPEGPPLASALDALIAAADQDERAGAVTSAVASSADFASVLQRASDTMGAAKTGARRRTIPKVEKVKGDRTRTRQRFRRPLRASQTERVIDLAALERAGLMPSLNPSLVTVTDGRPHVSPLRRGGDVLTTALVALGVPHTMLTSAENGRINLGTVISRLPVPPPMITGHGAMIAFVGEASIVLNVARAVSVALHQDPDACVFLSPGARPVGFIGEQISVIDDLGRRRDEWSSLDRLTVVAIDIGFARQDVAWGRHAVSMLRPAMRWGVVAATRKAEDIRAWSRGIGGLHALAVTGIGETASPAAVLGAGVPVARLDGQVATPELWLRVLSDRLAEQSTRRAPDLIAT